MRLFLTLLGLGCCAIVTACGSSGTRLATVAMSDESAVPFGIGDHQLSQRILRVRFEGEPGQAGFRLVLRLVSEKQYQMSASDPFGRRIWALEYTAPEARFVDYRGRRECRTTSPTSFVDIAFATLTVDQLPAILLGRLPSGLKVIGRAAESVELEDRDSRRWTAAPAPGVAALRSWTLWDAGAPLLWFRADDGGRMLSHRGGGQLRWREARVEEMTSAPQPLGNLAGVQLVSCEEMVGTRPGGEEQPRREVEAKAPRDG